jgi:phosphoglycerate dehydrogenase-like enzyme
VALFGRDRWHDLLSASDYGVNALPLTAETRGMFGEAEVRALQTCACFIFVGRGATVREAVLVRALREGWIGAAGLDVFETEPLPPESELYTLPNVIVSPHSADQTSSFHDASAGILRENVRRYLSGEPLEKLVDKRQGY